MLIKTGGGDPSLGQAGEGIHWHMNIANKITYFATDEQRQVIPWVRMEDKNGKVTEYMVKDGAPTQAQIDKADKRRMDCIDCHNRPIAHLRATRCLRGPRRSAGAPSMPRLPFIKQQGVEVLTADYKTTDEAQKAIADKIPKFYQDKYPQIASAKADSIKGAVVELQRIYRHHVLPLHEGELEDPSQQHRALVLSGLLPLPRWQPRQQGWQGHQQRLQLLPHGDGSAGRRHADRLDAGPALQAPG